MHKIGLLIVLILTLPATFLLMPAFAETTTSPEPAEMQDQNQEINYDVISVLLVLNAVLSAVVVAFLIKDRKQGREIMRQCPKA